MKLNDLADIGFLTWLPLVFFYIVGFVGAFTPSLETEAMAFINSEQYWNVSESEQLLIERLEALLWLIGFFAFIFGGYRAKNVGPRVWLAGFSLMCFLALGEEASWGQHYLGYETPDALAAVNVQNEMNLHNTDLAVVLDVSTDSQLYPYLGNLTHYLNPLFFAFCLCVWGLAPALIRAKWLMGRAALTYPVFETRFYVTLCGFSALYLITDQIFFDAGELLELTLATAGCCFGLLSVSGRYGTLV